MARSNATDNDIAAFSTTVPPPPPYPGDRTHQPADDAQYDLTPTPHNVNRPRLPEDRRNHLLQNLPEDANIVKFQTIVREGKEIVVGRIKIPTPGTAAHAFILRRYDTNAISLTTMYKVAFPSATEEDEKREMDWVKSSFDTRGTNGGRGSDVVRLAGQWVSRHLAIHLAPAYGLSELIASLARAVPDPNVAYRKSQRSQAASDEIAKTRTGETPAAHQVPSFTATTETASPAPKRQRRDPSAGASASTPVEEDARHLTLEATTTVTAPAGAAVDMEAEIQSAKQLVMDLKRELRLRAAAGEDLQDQGFEVAEEARGTKRGKNSDEGVSISSGAAGKDRIVRRNKRIVQSPVVENAKRVAWGALIFGLGVGAATLLPQFAASFL